MTAALAHAAAPRMAFDAQAPAQAGEAIYLRGISGAGSPVGALREPSKMHSQGRDVACVNCHLHSGLGTTEGHIIVPPVTGRYLYQPPASDHKQPDLPYVEGMHRDRVPYTDAALARAIREGVDSEGKPLGPLMPRFEIGDEDMASLIAYLKKLDPHHVPGVTENVLHFATIITPDADPVKRAGMLDVMQKYFEDKNTRVLRTLPKMHTSENTMYSKTMYMVNRRWQLHVWELTGAPETWEGQLTQLLAKEPVFAVISGIGGSNWAPVRAFCEHERVPCVFPNVEVPVVEQGDFYSLYFSRGVLLEAELIAKALREAPSGHTIKAVRQVYRAGDSGAAAAHALTAALEGSGIAVHDEVLAPRESWQGVPGAAGDSVQRVAAAAGEGRRGVAAAADKGGQSVAAAADESEHGVARSVGKAAADEALVLWLRAEDLAALGAPPARTAPVYLSGLMGGLEHAPLPAGWRPSTWVAYPFDMPDKRVVRIDYALGWFRIRHIPVVAEQVQADTYLACGLVAETLSHMVDTFVRDYFIERVDENLEHRILTGYYPRLSLAQGQNFASKGGYVVRFADADGVRLIAAHGWTVP